jgi:hypothetical protein
MVALPRNRCSPSSLIFVIPPRLPRRAALHRRRANSPATAGPPLQKTAPKNRIRRPIPSSLLECLTTRLNRALHPLGSSHKRCKTTAQVASRCRSPIHEANTQSSSTQYLEQLCAPTTYLSAPSRISTPCASVHYSPLSPPTYPLKHQIRRKDQRRQRSFACLQQTKPQKTPQRSSSNSTSQLCRSGAWIVALKRSRSLSRHLLHASGAGKTPPLSPACSARVLARGLQQNTPPRSLLNSTQLQPSRSALPSLGPLRPPVPQSPPRG